MPATLLHRDVDLIPSEPARRPQRSRSSRRLVSAAVTAAVSGWLSERVASSSPS